MIVDVLPKWERYTYWIVGVSGLAYSVYALFLEGQNNMETLLPTLSHGWSWLGRYQDQNDSEWQLWKTNLAIKSLAVVAHVMASRTCFYLKSGLQIHTCTLMVVDLASACALLGWRPVALLVCSAIIINMACYSGKTWLVWLLAVLMIYSTNNAAISRAQISMLGLSGYYQRYQFIVIAGFFHMRFISFGMEKINHRAAQAAQTRACHDEPPGTPAGFNSLDSACENDSTATVTAFGEHTAVKERYESASMTKVTGKYAVDTEPTLCDLLLYSFYWPTFIFGPIYTYREFHQQITQAFTSHNFVPDTYDILKQLLRMTFWGVFVEFQSHFLYHSAIIYESTLIETASNWAVGGAGYWSGQYFMIKYAIVYGIATQVSRFDGLSPLARPRCISWVCSYTDMWRYFDVGLHNFTTFHIYIPLGGSRAGVCRQILASGLVFFFILFWHGHGVDKMVWLLFNYATNSLEVIACALGRSSAGRSLKSRISPAMYLRLKVLLMVPLYMSAGLSMMYFFFDGTIGKRFSGRLATKATWTQLLTFAIIVGTSIHNGIYLGQWYGQRVDHSSHMDKSSCKTSHND